jgi:hypothetical protein
MAIEPVTEGNAAVPFGAIATRVVAQSLDTLAIPTNYTIVAQANLMKRLDAVVTRFKQVDSALEKSKILPQPSPIAPTQKPKPSKPAKRIPARKTGQ